VAVMVAKRVSTVDKTIRITNTVLLSVFTLLILYPIYLVLISSVSDPLYVNTGRVIFWVRGFTLSGYERILEYNDLWRGYRNTIVYVTLHIAISVSVTLLAAYALSRKKLIFRSFFSKLIVFTMFVHGGIIPLFIIVRKLGLLDTMWAVVILGSVQVWNLIVSRTFFQTTIPQSLYDAANIDGANDFQVFFQVVVPLSKAIAVVMVLYYGVNMWNDFYKSLIYLRDESKFPLQIVLRDILMQSRAQEDALDLDSLQLGGNTEDTAELIKYGTIVVSSLPIITLYPFLQKHFVKGVMIGSIKG
jgi:putative aldouronate transport system permease protein